MKRIQSAVLFMGLLLALNTQAFADHTRPEGLELDKAMVGKLMAHAVRHSRYEMPARLPAVYVIDPVQLNFRVCQGDCGYVGYFDRGTRVIYISNDLQIKQTLVSQSYVIHELVHYLQFLNGEMNGKMECKKQQQLETEAYAVQNRFLSHSFRALSLPVVRLEVMFRGDCRLPKG